MERAENTRGDYWQRFRDAAPKSISLELFKKPIRDFIVENVLAGTFRSGNKRELSFAGQRLLAIGIERMQEIANTEHDWFVSQKVNEISLGNLKVEDINDYSIDIKLRQKLNAAIGSLLNSESLWFDQKVHICFTVLCKTVLVYRASYKSTNENDYEHGKFHRISMSTDEWDMSGRAKFARELFDAHLRELRLIELAISKIDFSCLEELLGQECESAIKVAKSLVLSQRIALANENMGRIDSIAGMIVKQRAMRVRDRGGIAVAFYTYDEEFHLELFDLQRHKQFEREAAMVDFVFGEGKLLDKLFGWAM